MKYLLIPFFVFLASTLTLRAQKQAFIYELDPFEVSVMTATRTPRMLSEVPIKTEVLSADTFNKVACTSIGEAVELINGVRTERDCQNCDAAQIQLLGLPGNYNQILVDGHPLFTGVASVYGIDQVPTIFIDSLEVVKGGASALYGPGAVAGVVNIIPREPFQIHSRMQYDFRNVDGATGHGIQFEQGFVLKDKPIKWTIYGQLEKQNEYDRSGDEFFDLTRTHSNTIGAYMWFAPFDKTSIRLNYQLIHEDRRGGNNLDGPNQFSQISEDLSTDYHWATLSLDQELTDRFDISVSGSFVHLRRDSYYGGTGAEVINPNLVIVTEQGPANGTYNGALPNNGGSPDQQRAFALFGNGTGGGGSYNQFGILDSKTYLFNAQGNYDFSDTSSGSHLITFGVQYEYEELFDENVNAFGRFLDILQDEEFKNIGFYFQDQWQVNDQLEFVPGIRVDKASTLEDTIISPRIAARFNVTEELTLRGNLSTGFLAPRIFSEDTHVDNLAGRPHDTYNADGLREERSYTFAVGADYTPEALDGKFTTSIQNYFTLLKDSFTIDPTDMTPGNLRGTYLRKNSSGSTVFGIDWDAAWAPNRNWRLDLGLAYTSTRYDEAQVLADDGLTSLVSERYNKAPDWSGLLQLTYLNAKAYNAFIGLKWTGPMYVAQNAPTAQIVESKPFYVFNIGLSRAFNLGSTELTVKIGVNNVFDDFQGDLQSGADRDSGYVYGPRYPRTFHLGLDANF